MAAKMFPIFIPFPVHVIPLASHSSGPTDWLPESPSRRGFHCVHVHVLCANPRSHRIDFYDGRPTDRPSYSWIPAKTRRLVCRLPHHHCTVRLYGSPWKHTIEGYVCKKKCSTFTRKKGEEEIVPFIKLGNSDIFKGGRFQLLGK